MPISKCRVCNKTFFEAPLIEYHNMPKAAQFLPDKDSLLTEKGVDLNVCQCSGCGLVQLSNEPVPYYKEVIRAAAVSQEMKDFRDNQFKTFIKKHSLKEKKVIEIGCGRGEYLSILKNTGAIVSGLEYSEESVKQCIVNGLNVSQGFLESSDYMINGAPFDGFFMLNFLEHLPEQNLVLSGIYNNLTDQAVGLLEVPNFNMILRKHLFSEFIGDHLFYFTKDTLTTTLNLNGFEVIDCSEIWNEYIISAVIRKRNRLNIDDFQKHQANLKYELEKYLSCFRSKNVAIWGAGHQALAIISLIDLSGKIKYVIDSAAFKQGKYTPATHIPIVSPDVLHSDPVEAVIIMAASYSDEVARTIRQKYDKTVKIAILRDYGLQNII